LEPLDLGPDWHDPLPLISLDAALERTLLSSDLSRERLIERVLADLGHPRLHPLLWVLPRSWRLAPAALPPRLQAASALLQQGLISPVFLTALVDDLAHLWPLEATAQPTPLQRWQADSLMSEGQSLRVPATLAALDALLEARRSAHERALVTASQGPPSLPHLSRGLRWSNVGLDFSQSPWERLGNALMAQVFNRLAANAVTRERFVFEGCCDGAALLSLMRQRDWTVRARLRCSVASFGFGAALVVPGEATRQIPLGLPLRTGLLDDAGEEVTTLLPHTALELELTQAERSIRLQWFQGTGGFCGWDALNDLHRPWQNDRHNGSVRYLGEPFGEAELPRLMQLCELIALVHNQEATERHLRQGGYGSLGFCIDSTALLQLALRGVCDLYPLVLPGLWRERLDRRAVELCRVGVADAEVAGPYRRALAQLPLDLSHHGPSSSDAWRRLQTSAPQNSPFALLQHLRTATPLPPPAC